MKTKEPTRNAVAAGATIIGLCLLIAVATLVSGCNGDEPPSIDPPEHPWMPCECDAPMFQLSGVEDTARYTVVPDRSTSGWMYKMGELVSITYKIPADKRLVYWHMIPPSNLAAYSQDATIYIYMTDDIWVRAATGDRYVSISTTTATLGGTIVRDPDEIMYEYGSEVALIPIPNPGWVPYRWGSSIPGQAANFGYQRRDQITVKAEGNYVYNLSWVPDDYDEWPTLYRGDVVLQGEGTADVFTAEDFNSVSPVAPFYHSASDTPRFFSAACRPHRGYDLVFWRWVRPADGMITHFVNTHQTAPGGRYTLPLSTYGISLDQIGDTVFEAHLTKTVSLDIEVAGQGVVTSDDFRSYWNPKPYGYGIHCGVAEPTKAVQSKRVIMTAVPCPGWAFNHWEIKDSGGQWQIAGATNKLTVYMNWWGEGNLFHIPENQETHYVKAVFQSNKRALCVHGGDAGISALLNPVSPSALSDNGYVVTYMKKPTANEVYSAIAFNNVFTFWGHGIEEKRIIVQDNWFGENEEVSWEGVKTHNGSNQYLLVVLSACYAGGDANWKKGFNAECVIGWSTKVRFGRLQDWEKRFWPYVFSDHSAAAAAVKAYIDTQPWIIRQVIWPKKEEIRFYGSVRLPQCNM